MQPFCSLSPRPRNQLAATTDISSHNTHALRHSYSALQLSRWHTPLQFSRYLQGVKVRRAHHKARTQWERKDARKVSSQRAIYLANPFNYAGKGYTPFCPFGNLVFWFLVARCPTVSLVLLQPLPDIRVCWPSESRAWHVYGVFRYFSQAMRIETMPEMQPSSLDFCPGNSPLQ